MVTGDCQEEVLIFRDRQTHMHHNIYIVNIVITIIMLVNMINVIITTVASKAYGGINPKILKIYLISTVVEVTMNMAEYTTSWPSAVGAA